MEVYTVAALCLPNPSNTAYVPIPKLTLAAPRLSTNPDLSSVLVTRSLKKKKRTITYETIPQNTWC